MLTLKDIQTGQFQTAAGYCVTSPQFLELVNDVVDELVRRGDWSSTILPIRVCIKNGCVTWPRYVGEVRKINTCRGNAPVQTVWHQFLEHGDGYGGIYGWNAWIGEQKQMTAQSRAPTYNDIYGPNCTVRIYPSVPQDVGAQVVIFGTDNNGQPLQTDNGDGTWSRGITITVASPFGSSNTFVSSIDRVVKSATQGNLNVFAYDSVQNALFDLAVWEPSESSPNYLRYQLSGGWHQQQCNGNCFESVVALVKLQNIPIKVPTDLVIIDNRRALLLGIRAMKKEDAGEDATQLWKSAIEALNRQLENSEPEIQFAAQNNTFGRRTFRNQTF